jgi:tetratricopeptide (TPR) repeat protein
MSFSNAWIRPWAMVLVLLPGCGQGGDVDAYLRSAQIAIAAGEYDAASLALNNVLQARPDDTSARLQLARVALVAGRPGLAERQARTATRIAPDDEAGQQLLCQSLRHLGDFNSIVSEFIGATSAPLLNCRGFAYLHLGSGAEAHRLFTQAIDAAPGSIEARIGLAQSEQALGNLPAAQRQLKEILNDDPFSIAAYNALGSVHAQQGRYGEAQLAFLDAVGLPHDLDNTSDWLQARVGLAETYWRLGDKQRALAETRDLLTSFASHPLPKYLRALFAYEDGEYPLASEYLRGVLGVLPDHKPSQQLSAAADLAQGRVGSAQIHIAGEHGQRQSDPTMVLLLSQIYMSMGNASEAAAIMERVDVQDLDAISLAHAANALAYAGNLNRALDRMARAVVRAPNDIELQIDYAAMLLQDGQLQRCDELMAQWPTNPRTQQARSKLRLLRFLRAGDTQRAEAYAKRRRRENPNEMIALLALAEAAEKRGVRDQAVSWLEVARERNPKAVEPRFLLADYARRAGDADNLRVLAEEILAALPFNSGALALLGEAYLDAGNTFAAIETLREAHRVAPSSAQALLSLVRSQLASGDFWQVRKEIKRAIARDTLTPASLRALIIEEYRRGNAEQAHALAEDLTNYLRAPPEGARVQGDLYMLGGQYDEAVGAYTRAQASESSRIVAVKATIAAVVAGLDDPAAAIEKWLQESPSDRQLQRVQSAAYASGVAGPL